MCGISGVFIFKGLEQGLELSLGQLTQKSIQTLKNRGRDAQGFFVDKHVSLGHTRLSIIDTSVDANQPMTDPSGRYTIIFNGEIFNYREIAQKITSNGIELRTKSDTEVLLYAYILWGNECLELLNGFFSFAVYDNLNAKIFIVRDRFGVKPLVYYIDSEKIIFASEIKAILAYKVPKQINKVALLQYLQLNYIPAPNSIFEHIIKLLPGHYIEADSNGYVINQYYTPADVKPLEISYEKASKKIEQLVEDAVVRRLVSDVPLGAFLSGGVDSTIVSALAARHTKLHTFSIGFKDQHFFDETPYARLAAQTMGTEHTVFELSIQDIEDELFNAIDYFDEPFADSSAIAYYILSKKTAPHIKVALTGDGADEVFGGYNKHLAEAKIRNSYWVENMAEIGLPIFELFPASRHTFLGNKIRQIQKYADGKKLTSSERYWKWCGYADEAQAWLLLNKNIKTEAAQQQYFKQKTEILKNISQESDLNKILLTDIQLVLPNDMLTKVDMCTMANSQEARNPFLDCQVVDFALSLPIHYKVDRNSRKKILIDAFANILPEKLASRPKHGFEIPVRYLIIHKFGDFIEQKLLNKDFITEQGLFDHTEITNLIKKFYSTNPSDTHARVWGLLIFQLWWEKYYK